MRRRTIALGLGSIAVAAVAAVFALVCRQSPGAMMRSHELPDDISDFIDRATEDVYRDQHLPSWNPYDLPEPLLTAWAVEQAQGIIDNGGFQYFFEKDWPDNPPYSVFTDAFRRIGAVEAADIIDRAVMMFPSDKPHLDHMMRRRFMDELRKREGTDESTMDRMDVRVMDLGGDTFIRLAAYIRKHSDYFPSVKDGAEPSRATGAAAEGASEGGGDE